MQIYRSEDNRNTITVSITGSLYELYDSYNNFRMKFVQEDILPIIRKLHQIKNKECRNFYLPNGYSKYFFHNHFAIERVDKTLLAMEKVCEGMDKFIKEQIKNINSLNIDQLRMLYNIIEGKNKISA